MKEMLKDRKLQICAAIVILGCIIFGSGMIAVVLIVIVCTALAILIAEAIDKIANKFLDK